MSEKIKNVRYALVAMLLCFTAAVQAQTVKGNVKDKSLGEAVIGATIVEVGQQNNGTVTDFDGNFSLTLKGKSNKLQVSYIGMKTVTIDVKGKSSVDVVLEDDNTVLQEVVAVGYGSVKKKDLMGSVATVDNAKLMEVPVANAAEALQGKLAGVQITTTEGSPDADVNIRVRGGGSITQSNEPLYIVDGFPVESISDIPASDIQDITVLKDASSTAIYGSRGANGVILVTTKGGKEGKVEVSYNFYYSFKNMLKKLPVLSAKDYASWQYEHAQLLGKPEYYTDYFGDYQDMNLYDNIATNDWQDQTYGRTGHTMNHAININGGSDVMKYAFSYARMDDKAIMQNSNFTRDNLSLKLNHKIGKKISLDYSIRWSRTTIGGGGANEQSSSYNTDKRLRYAVQFVPFPVDGISNVTDDDTDASGGNFYNPITSIYDNDQQRERNQLNMQGAFTWEIFKNFKFKAEMGYESYTQNTDKFWGTTTYYVKNVPAEENKGLPATSMERLSRYKVRNTNTVTYDFKKLFKTEDHHLDVLLGQEYSIQKQNTLTTINHGYPSWFNSDTAWKFSSQGVAYSSEDVYDRDDKLSSWFGRANYNYLGRYYATATFRADGSSKFAEGNRWGFFPSASIAWRISGEKFMEKTQDWLTDLKIRASIGSSGNNNIPSGASASQDYSASTTSWINGITKYWAPSKTMANPDLKWETTITRNIGLDYSLFNSRINGSIDVYFNNTKDLLIQFPTSGTGYDYQYRNMGETRNNGIEFTINYDIVNKKQWGINISANLSHNSNKVVSLGSLDEITGISSGWASSEIDRDFTIKVGEPVGQIYGYVADGRYEVSDFDIAASKANGKWTLKEGVPNATAIGSPEQPGSIKVKDLNGDGKIDTDDRQVIGNTNPDLTGGFSLNARAYGFDFAANFNFSIGNDVYNANAIEYTQTSKYRYRNMITDVAAGNRWTNIDPATGTLLTWDNAAQLAALNAATTTASPYTTKYILTSDYVQNASFLRLGTLTLGYTLPKSILKKIYLNKLRVYFTCYNLLTITGYDGTDPEVNSIRKTNLTPGVDYSAYPKSRQFVFGLNLNF